MASVTAVVSDTDGAPVAAGAGNARTVPDVAGPDGSRGEPTATTASPTCSDSESPSTAGVNVPAPRTLITARSDSGSRPTIDASYFLPFERTTSSVPPSAAPDTTWLFVSTSP